MIVQSNVLTEIHKRPVLNTFLLCLIAGLLTGEAAAQEKGEWPCFHGLSRNNMSMETGFLKQWPEKILNRYCRHVGEGPEEHLAKF